MKFSSNNSADIRKYFEKTYIKLKELGDKILWVERVRNEGIECIDIHGDVVEVLLDHEVEYDMEYTLPHRGCFLYCGKVAMLQRVPSRQWKKGISTENTRIIWADTARQVTMGFEALEAFSSKPAYTQLAHALCAPSSSVLSQRAWYSPEKQALFLDSKKIGVFSKGTLSVPKMFQMEVEKLRQCTQVEIKYA